ncbi:hypothetical protein GT50_18375 [Geobacillus stearothermophilus 10]|nr:hypothetical protein GT50_18375 [Geobacillus stearothermophilus 10]
MDNQQPCNKIAFIENGNLKLVANIGDVTNFLGYKIKTSNNVEALKILDQILGIQCKLDGEIIIIQHNEMQLPNLLKELTLNGIDVYHVEEIKNKLENLFLKKVGI